MRNSWLRNLIGGPRSCRSLRSKTTSVRYPSLRMESLEDRSVPTTLTTLASFTGNNGSAPVGSLVRDSAGDLFGATQYGGSSGDGTVFEIAAGSSAVATLGSFSYSNGAFPNGVALDSAGNLYGTTQSGGSSGYGTVFEIAAGSNTITTLANFSYGNGSAPSGGVVLDGAGNLFGTTQYGGSSYDGTVFEIAAGSNTITTLANFTGDNGANPSGEIVLDSAGNLYGTTQGGGSSYDGTVFEIAAGSNTITTLASFNDSNGSDPTGGLILDRAGNLYGTTTYGGTFGEGTVFEIAHGTTTITSLASFNYTFGAYPVGGLALDSVGNLYGTTEYGGDYDGDGNSDRDGIIFAIIHGTHTITGLKNFNYSTIGAYPTGGVLLDDAGHLYGTTQSGSNGGTVWEVATPLAISAPTITYGQNAVVTLSVAAGTSLPSGTVTLTVDEQAAADQLGVALQAPDNGTTYTATLVNDSATFTIPGLNSVEHLLHATFTKQGDSAIAESATLGLFVNKAPSSVTIAGGGTFAYDGAKHSASAVVSGVGAIDPNAAVLTYTGDQASLSPYDQIHPGTYTVTATFAGDANHLGSSASTTITIGVPSKDTTAVHTVASYMSDDGYSPHAGVVQDSAGNFYGTTFYGGSDGDGTVWEIVHGTNTITTLASFTGNNGSNPSGGVVLDSAGNLYGTTPSGGSSGYGTVFEIAAGSHTITTLANFDYSVAARIRPAASFWIAPATSTARHRAAAAVATARYSKSPRVHTPSPPWPTSTMTTDRIPTASFWTAPATFTARHSTAAAVAPARCSRSPRARIPSPPWPASTTRVNGAYPSGGVVLDSAGNLYGTTSSGGSSYDGTVFEVAAGSNTITALASFDYTNSGAYPSGVVLDEAGNLYGTTSSGGSSNYGTVFEIVAGSNTLTALASFDFSNGGEYPSGVVLDSAGNLYGTTQYGGSNGDGTVFEIAAGSNTVTTLANFNYDVGEQPFAGVVRDAAGNLFGTTLYGGGGYGEGTVYEIAAGSSTITTLASFTGDNGAYPFAGVVLDSAGNLFGTTQGGGAFGEGTVYEIARGTKTIATLASFNFDNGAYPADSLVLDGAGNLYGITPSGGSVAPARCSRSPTARIPSPHWPASTSTTARVQPAHSFGTTPAIFTAPPTGAEAATPAPCSSSRRARMPLPPLPASSSATERIPPAVSFWTTPATFMGPHRAAAAVTPARCSRSLRVRIPSPHWPASTTTTERIPTVASCGMLPATFTGPRSTAAAAAPAPCSNSWRVHAPSPPSPALTTTMERTPLAASFWTVPATFMGPPALCSR